MPNLRNFAHTSNFAFGTNLFGESTVYSVQECNLPGISFNHIEVAKRAVFGNIQGDTLTYNNLYINIILDEDLKNWIEIVSSLQKMRDPTTTNGISISEDSWLEIHDDNSNRVLKLSFKNCILETIEDVAFSTTSEDEILTVGINIKYDYYTIE